MPNPKVLVTLFIALAAALAAAQTLPITANVQPYGAPPYSPKAPGTMFNLYEWVVINGTVTPQADFYGNVTVTVFDTATNLAVASCTATGIGLSQGVTYSLYNILHNILQQGGCALTLNPGYTFVGLVKVRSDGLALNFTDVPLIGPNRYIVYVTFKSTAGTATFSARFSISNSINMTVKAFGVNTITSGATYPHNTGYDFRMVVNVTHPDGRPYYNNSISVTVNGITYINYWTNLTQYNIAHGQLYPATPATWVLTIPGTTFTSPSPYSIIVDVSNVRVSVNSTYNIVGYNVTGVNTGQLSFTLNVTNKLTVNFINVTAVWPNYTSTPPSFRNKPTGVSYTSPASFDGSMWTLGDAFLLYASVQLANGTMLPPSLLTPYFGYGSPLTYGVANKTTARGNYTVVAVNATLQESEWSTYYRPAYSGVMVNATLSVSDGNGNTGTLPLTFIVTNTTKSFTPTIFYNASKAAILNGSRVNLGDVIALNLAVVTYGGRTLNFTKGFDITVYNVTRSGLNNYTSLFSVRPENGTIYLVVDPSRNAWGINSTNWRSFMNATYLAVNVTECGMPGRMNLTLWWPGYLGGGRYKSFNINVTAKLPKVWISFNRTTVDYGQGVMLNITFWTYGGNATVAKNLTLYVYKIDTQTRPFGWSNASVPFIEGITSQSAGNYTFAFNVNGSYPWIPGVWYINATVGDIFGNAGDLNNTQLFAIRPNISHSLPASLRVMAGGVVSLYSPVSWGNGTLIQPSAHMNVTINVYPTPSGTSYTTLPLGTIANYFAAPFQAPNIPGPYSIVVNFTYMTLGKTLNYVWTINLTVYVAINATFSSMKSSPSQVAVVVGESTPRGPVQGALVEDDLAAAILAGLIGTSNAYFDIQLLNPTTLTYTSTASSYRYIIAIGGPLVNLFSYKYNSTLSSIVETYREVVGGNTVEVGFKVMVNSTISRVYLNLTNNEYYIVYANGTVKAAGSYGNTDFAIIATVYDPSVGKYIFISYGLDWRGTVAAGQWLAANVNNLSQLAKGQLVLLQWINGVGTAPILSI